MQNVFESERVENVYTLYDRSRNSSDITSKKSIDLLKLPRDIPYIYISDIVDTDNGLRFRFRFMGTGLVEILKQEATGKFIADLPLGGWELEWRKTLIFVVETRRPAVAVDKFSLPNGISLAIEHLALPLSDNGDQITHVLGTIEFLGFDYDRIKSLSQKVEWDDIQKIDVPKRMAITNLSIDLDKN